MFPSTRESEHGLNILIIIWIVIIALAATEAAWPGPFIVRQGNLATIELSEPTDLRNSWSASVRART